MTLRVAMALPLVASVVLWVAGPRLGRWLPPATAVRLLTAAMLATALATGFTLAVAGFVLIAQLPVIAVLGHWSTTVVETTEPLPDALGGLAGLTVALLLVASARRAVRAGRDLVRAAVVCRRLGPAVAGLVVVQDDVPDAYALPGLGGRVVVSTAMLRALPADERRVLLAHEAAHLTHRHHLYVQLGDLAAAANPLLRPAAQAVRHAVERWADEVAAEEVGDRPLTARALARAGLARSVERRQALAVALAAADSAVVDRVHALLGAAPRRRPMLAGALTALILLTTAGAAVTAHDTEARFELAHVAYTASR